MTSPAVVRETEKLRARTPKSAKLFEEGRKLAPSGVHSNYRLIDPYPLYFSSAQGSRLWDIDANEYIDFNMAFGALVVGHAHAKLTAAISDQIGKGTIYGYEGADCNELAKTITSRFHVDMVRFSSTGAEATMHALRIARAYRGRNKVLKFEGCYHGSHDALLVSVKPSKEKQGDPKRPSRVPASTGIPPSTIENTLVAPFNDLEATQRIAQDHREDLAAIILEPIAMNMGFVPAEPDFIRGLRKIADETGAVLIFDEIKTCGKFFHGISDYYSVEPDMKTMGKAIAGGYPLSVTGGRREIMEKIVPGILSHAGTFNSNPLCVRAALVTLKEILTEDAFKRLGKLGELLAEGYQDIVKDRRLNGQVQWAGPSGALVFADRPVTDWRSFQTINVGRWFAYWLSMLNEGIIPCGTGPDEQWTISVAHNEQDIQTDVEAFDKAAKTVEQTMESLPIVEAI
jgi:glutamate-1-semialdehyde 2,1-aminomutase